jgi:DNA-binding GntR family transcriptional regulator
MFLEIRFGVLSARYLPGQLISKAEVSEVYDCRPAGVAEVLNALVHEGYLIRQGRSEFAVRTWGREEVEDLFEMRANFEGLAAYRAAERATAAEISLLEALALEAREASKDDHDALERVVLENFRFHFEVMRMSRITLMPDMARMVLPNALHRRIVWSQRADDAEQSFRMHQKIAAAIGERTASMARLLMREDIYSSREAVLATIEDLAGREASEAVTIVRFPSTFEFEGRLYGQGTREPGADGRTIPFGVPAGNLR